MSPAPPRTDEALLEAWRSGELSAFDALYGRYEGPLYGFIFRQLSGETAEAEDVLHQTFLAVLKEAKARPVLRVRALLFEVARNGCLNRLRTRRRAANALNTAVDLVPPAWPDAHFDAKETAAALQAAVTRLPSTLSEVYALRAAGLSYEEVAQVLDVPLGTVKSRLHEVVSRLRKELTS